MQPRTRSDARANHERLLEAARQVFAERGLEADIRDICQRADVGMGTFYRNFANKDALVDALMEDVVCQVEVTLDAALAEADALAGIRLLVERMLEMAEEHRKLIQAFQAAGQPKPHRHEDLLMEKVAALFVRAQDAGAIRNDVPAAFLVRSLQGVFMGYLDQRDTWDVGEARRYSLALFMDALEAGPKTAPPFVMPSYEAIEAFCKKWNVIEFSLFGSVLRDDFRPDSDVDVLVVFAPDARWSMRIWIDMKDELREMFGREIDLVERAAVEESTNPYRRKSILESAKAVYAAA